VSGKLEEAVATRTTLVGHVAEDCFWLPAVERSMENGSPTGSSTAHSVDSEDSPVGTTAPDGDNSFAPPSFPTDLTLDPMVYAYETAEFHNNFHFSGLSEYHNQNHQPPDVHRHEYEPAMRGIQQSSIRHAPAQAYYDYYNHPYQGYHHHAAAPTSTYFNQ
jgi:hypothetical protein